MSTRKPRQRKEVIVPAAEAPTLIKCGNNFINPEAVSCIRAVKQGELYIVKFRDDPNPEYPCWVKPADIEGLLARFKIEGDE